MNAFATATATPASGPIGPVRQTLFGRFMLPDMSEHACQVQGISIDGATFDPAQVPAGLSIVAYLEEVGRIEASSGDAVPGGFKVVFSLTGSPRPLRNAPPLAVQ